MKRMEIYTFETQFFPRIKNSWGWIKEDIDYKFNISTNVDKNFMSFEEIIEFFKSY